MTTKTRLDPPDGGWGILVCIGIALLFIIGLTGLPSFGLLLADFLRSIGSETSELTIITSIGYFSLSFAGLFAGSLFNRFGLRPVGMFGAFIYVLGAILQIFVTSIWMLTINAGILQAFGFGLMIPASLTSFNNYFVKNRILWMSLTQCLIGLGSVGVPVLIHKILDFYGFRGSLIVLAGLSTHVILSMLVMQPVEWHMRRVVIEDAEEQKEFIQLAQKSSAEAKENLELLNDNSTTLRHDSHENVKVSTEALKIRPGQDFQKKQHFSREDMRIRSSRSSSIVSLGNWTGPDALPEMITRPRGHSIAASCIKNGASAIKVEDPIFSFWQKTVDFLDLTLLKSPIFNNILLGICFVAYSDVTFFIIHPLYLYTLNFSRSDTASIVAIGAAADLVSKLFLAFSSLFIQMPPPFVHVLDFVGIACATAAIGFFRSWIHVPVPLIFAEYLPKERFATGYGLYMFLHGIFIFIVGPFVGYLRDVTKDYILVFHILNACLAVCVIPWVLEIVCVKFRRKGKISSSS